MQELNIEKFSPKKAELQTLAEKYKNLTINGVEDKTGYLQVDTARKDLKKQVSGIKNTGKELREDAIKFQKAVIKLENELIEIVEDVKLDLENKIKTIDEEKEKIKRMEFAPARKAKLAEIDVIVEDDFILLMDDQRFNEFYYQKKADYEEAKRIKAEQEAAEERRKLQEAQEKLDAERRALEEEKRIEEAKKQAAEEARLQAERDAKLAQEKAEREKQEAIEAEQRKAKEAAEQAEREKQAIIDEQNRKEAAIIKAEEDAKAAEVARLAKEKAEQEQAEKMKKYQKFLKDNGCEKAGLLNNALSADSFVSRNGNTFVLYKKIGEITIN